MERVEAYLREVLGEAAARRDADAGVTVALPADGLAPEALLAEGVPGDVVAWLPNDDGWSTVGRGVATSATSDRLDALATPCASALRQLRAVVHPACGELPPLRVFVARRFNADDVRDDPTWEAFPGAFAVLPRWEVSRRGDRSVLRVSARGDRDAGECLRELPAVMAALREPAVAQDVRATEAPGDREAWRSLVGSALAAMREGNAVKLVAARRSEVVADRAWSLASVLSALDASSRGPAGCVRFALVRGGTAFVGATPERLVSRRGLDVRADALAGSVPRAGDPDEDRARAEALLRGDKELREHAHVVDALRASLGELGAEVSAPARPAVRTLRTVHHLMTPVRATLSEANPAHVLALAEVLHPTPAMGGTPRAFATAWIAANEPAPRGLYAGPVGWCDAAGDGEFFVAIRSAVLRDDRAWMYAGAGLVEGSDPDLEYDETEAKMAPMRAALGVR